MQIETNISFTIKMDDEMTKDYNENLYEANQVIINKIKETIQQRVSESFDAAENIKVSTTFVIE